MQKTSSNNHIIKTAQLEWRNEKTPVSSVYDDVYFSADDGAAESQFVFLENNDLPSRFNDLFQQDQKKHFTIAETGFGTGLNFLQTCLLWKTIQNTPLNREKNVSRKLYFISTEIHPLKRTDLEQSHKNWPELAEFSQQLQAKYPPAIQGLHCLELTHGITLILIIDDAVNGFKKLQEHDHPQLKNNPNRAVDAWFLDGFAPSKNPGMWSEALFLSMAKLSHFSTTFSSFTAAGIVRRGLKQVGFDVKKVKGFGRKREMIRGQFYGLPNTHPHTNKSLSSRQFEPFWPIYRAHKISQKKSDPKTAIIIGAGIAGCSTAKLLADAGLTVTLLDQHNDMMQAASGNTQGVLFPKLSHQQGLLAEFNLTSFLYAGRFYSTPTFAPHFEKTGMLQQLKPSKLKDAKALIQRFQGQEDIVQLINAETASKHAGSAIETDCLWYPSTGWFRPEGLKQAFKDHSDFQFLAQHKVTSLHYQPEQDNTWQLNIEKLADNNEMTHLEADIVIIANANAANDLLKTLPDNTKTPLQLPLKNIRGQVTYVSSEGLPALNTTVCHEGYICPPDTQKKQYSYGASYDLHENSSDLLASSQTYNIKTLTENIAGFDKVKEQTQTLQGRVGYRCTTPDYLPVIGPVPIKSHFQQDFQNFAKTSKAFIPQPGSYYPGLMLNIAFGSRGFASAPLAAAIIRAYCLDQAFPLDISLLNAVNPARFLIRDIIRRKD